MEHDGSGPGRHALNASQLSRHLQAVVQWGFPLALFIAPLLYAPQLFEYSYLPKALWLQCSTAFFLLAWFVSQALAPADKRQLIISPLLAPIVIFLLWALLSMAWAINVYEVLERWRVWALAGGAFFLVTNAFQAEQHRQRLLTAMYSAGVVLACIGICQYLFGLDHIRQAAPPAATFGNRNMAIHLIVLILPLGGFLFLQGKTKAEAYVLPFSLALVGCYIVYTRTRGGWLAGLLEFALFAWVVWRWLRQKKCALHRYKWQGLGCGVLFFAALAALPPHPTVTGVSSVSTRLQTTYSQLTGDNVRLAIWRNSLAMVQDRPLLGTGLGNFQVYYPLYHDKVIPTSAFTTNSQTRMVHNDPLQILVELGLLGFALLLYLPGKVAIYQWSSRKAPPPAHSRLLSAALLIALLGSLANSLFSFPLQRATPTFFFAIILAVWAACQPTMASKRISGRQAGLFLSFALLLFIWIGSHSQRSYRADKLLWTTLRHNINQRWTDAMATAKAAYRLHPLRRKPVLIYLGEASLHANQPELAAKSFELLLEHYPYNPNGLASLAGSYAALGRYEEARQLFKQSKDILEESWLLHHNMGNMYLQLGQQPSALTAFHKSTRLNPSDARPWQQLALVAQQLQDTNTLYEAEKRLAELSAKKRASP